MSKNDEKLDKIDVRTESHGISQVKSKSKGKDASKKDSTENKAGEIKEDHAAHDSKEAKKEGQLSLEDKE